MILLRLTWRSVWNRRSTLLLTLASMTVSIALLLGIQYLSSNAKSSFLRTVSGTDLVVGARSGPVQLLLYSVFRIGNATNNIGWQSYQTIATNPLVKWTIPLSLGDSHRGFRVLGTNQDYFRHYQYGDKQALQLAQGQAFNGVFETVLGAEVARQLNYHLGDQIVIAHGASATQFTLHADKPFRVVGILQATGTPVDRTVHVPLEGIEAIHIDWLNGAKVPGYQISADEALKKNLQPKTLTAVLVGLNNRATAFRIQRELNNYKAEPLLAILPGVALAELWQALGWFERVLQVISGFVVVAGLLGLLTVLLATLNERRREMAILRAVGASPWQIVVLFVLESLCLASLSSALAVALTQATLVMARPWVMQTYGLSLTPWLPQLADLYWLGVIAGLAVLFSLIPGFIAYRRSLQDGLTIRV